MIRALTALPALLLMTACGGSGPPPSEQTTLTVFAAADLQPALDRVGQKLQATKHITTTFRYGGSQTLTDQITQGAPADVFASADTLHMNQLQLAGLLQGHSSVFAHNRLEIAVASGNPKGIHSLADLARTGLSVVLADPSVPAGKDAQLMLTTAGVRVNPAGYELQASAILSKIALGQADAGVVYVSDVVTGGRVDGVTIPDAQNVIATYPVAVLKVARNWNGGGAFVSLLLSPEGQAIMKSAGFDGV
jgi:molybdate transport system substrate-binding protein